MKVFAVIMIFIGTILVLGFILQETSIAHSVKDGNKILICYINGQYKVIPPSKIIGFNDQTNYWTFTNGYAKDCTINASTSKN